MIEVAGIGILWAFLAGTVSFLSPCVLPIVPGYVSYIAGRSVDELMEPGFSRARLGTLVLSASFASGFSAVFIALGASATAMGQLLQSFRGEADMVAGAIIVVFGLHLAGLLPIPLLDRDWRYFPRKAHPGGAGAFVLGAAFAFGWTPCIGPILGSILTLGATRASVTDGILLLAVYSLGLAVPFLLVAAFTGSFVSRLRSLGRVGHVLRLAAGALLIVVGLAMAAGLLTSFGTWLLTTIPWLQSLVI